MFLMPWIRSLRSCPLSGRLIALLRPSLAWIGALYLMHALLMPDIPGLAALRAIIDAFGAGPILLQTSRGPQRRLGPEPTWGTC